MRNPAERLADLRAQRAANLTGDKRRRRADRAARRASRCSRGMDEILDYAERRSRAAIARLPDGEYEADGRARGRPRRRPGRRAARARRSWTASACGSTSPAAPTRSTATSTARSPVTKSAAFFAVRVLTDPDAPPCAGAHRPIEVAAPEGCVLNARPPAAVAAGNVETSSRVADLVIEALAGATDAPAQGQGTMNNFTLAGDGVHLLRDDRRRPGRLPGRRRARARSTSRCRIR